MEDESMENAIEAKFESSIMGVEWTCGSAGHFVPC